MSSDVSLTNLELEFSDTSDTQSLYISLKPRFRSLENHLSSFFISDNIGGVDDGNTTLIGSTFLSTINFTVANVTCSESIQLSDTVSLNADGNVSANSYVLKYNKGFELYGDNELVSKMDIEYYIDDKNYSKELSDVRFVTYGNFLSQITLYELQNVSQVSNIVSEYVTGWFTNTHYITDVNFAEQINVHKLIDESYLDNYILTEYDNFEDYITLSNVNRIDTHVGNILNTNNLNYYDKNEVDSNFVSYANLPENVSAINASLQLTNETFVEQKVTELENTVVANFYYKSNIDAFLNNQSANVSDLSNVLSSMYYTKQNIDSLFNSNDISDFEFFQNSISTSLNAYYDKSNVDTIVGSITENVQDIELNLNTELSFINANIFSLYSNVSNSVQNISANVETLETSHLSLQNYCEGNINDLFNTCNILIADVSMVRDSFSDYYDKSNVDDMFQTLEQTKLSSLQGNIDVLNTTLSQNYLSKTETDSILTDLSSNIQSSHHTKFEINTLFYDKAYIDNALDTLNNNLGNIDSGNISVSLTNYYEKSNIDDMFEHYYTKGNVDTLLGDVVRYSDLDAVVQNVYNKEEIGNIVANISSNITAGITTSQFEDLLNPYLAVYSTTQEISAFYTPLSFLNLYYTKPLADARFLNVNDVDSMLSSLSFLKESEVNLKLENYYDKADVDVLIATSLSNIASGGNITINLDNYLRESNAEAFYVKKENFGEYFTQSMYKVDSQIESYLQDYRTVDELNSLFISNANVASLINDYMLSINDNIEHSFYDKTNVDNLFYKKTDFDLDSYYLKTESDVMFIHVSEMGNLVKNQYLQQTHYDKTECNNLFITHTILNERLESLPTAANISGEITGNLLLNYYNASTSNNLFVKHSDFDSKISSYELQNRNDVNNRINESLSNYYTTTQIDNLYIGYDDLPGIITQQGLLTQINASSFINSSLNNFYTKTESNNKFISYDNFTQALIANSVATHSFVSNQINSSFNDYYNKTYMNDTFLSKAGFTSELSTYNLATTSTVNTLIDSKIESYRDHISNGVNHDIEAYMRAKFGPQTEVISYSGGGLVTKHYVDNIVNGINNTIESFIEDDDTNAFLNKIQSYLNNGDLNFELTNSLRTLLLGSYLDESLEYNYVIRDLYNRVSSNNTFEITYNVDTSSWNGAVYSLHLELLSSPYNLADKTYVQNYLSTNNYVKTSDLGAYAKLSDVQSTYLNESKLQTFLEEKTYLKRNDILDLIQLYNNDSEYVDVNYLLTNQYMTENKIDNKISQALSSSTFLNSTDLQVSIGDFIKINDVTTYLVEHEYLNENEIEDKIALLTNQYLREQDLTALGVTESAINAKISVALTPYVTKDSLTLLINDFVTDTQVDDKINQSVSDLVSTTTLVNEIHNAIMNIDYSNFATTQDYNDMSNVVTTMQSNIELLNQGGFSTANIIQDVTGNILTNVYTKSEIDSLMGNISIESNTSCECNVSQMEWISANINELSQDISNIQVSFLTKDNAQELYLSKSEIFGNVNTYIHQDIEPKINIFQFDIGNIRYVDIASTDDDDIAYFFDDAEQENEHNSDNSIYFRFNGNSATLDDNVLTIGSRIFIRTPAVYEGDLFGKNKHTRFNGIYVIEDIDTYDNIHLVSTYTYVKCKRSEDFKTFDTIRDSFIYVKSQLEGGVSNKTAGSSFIVTSPTQEDASTFVLDQSNIDVITLHHTNFGSLARQEHTDVNITGGTISIDTLKVNHIECSTGKTVSVLLPDSSTGTKFTVRSRDMESGIDADNNVLFAVDGTGHTSAYQFNALSDKNLKKNIQTIENPLELVNHLTGKTFEWNDETRNTKGVSYGFIAQEVGEHFPSLVDHTLNGHLSVDYAKVVSILVESVKSIANYLEASGITSGATVSNSQNNNVSQNNIVSQNNGNNTNTFNIIQDVDIKSTTTNVIGVGDNSKNIVTVDMASTPYDTIHIQELFGNSGNYTLFTNNGTNTLDKSKIHMNTTVLIKDCPEKKYNGVYIINDIQESVNSTFSRCTRVSNFKDFANIHNSFVSVKPTGIYGGAGQLNPGLSFLCIEPVLSEQSTFGLDTHAITFAGFGVNELRTMSTQDKENVHITGGNINIPSIQTNVITPLDDSSTVSVDLGGSSEYFKFEVKNNDESVFSVNGRGVASAHTFYEPSDRNLKKNDVQIYDAIELVRKLRGVTFDWKDNSRNKQSHPNYGFIAQEVNLHFPSLVDQRTDGLYAVDYSKVVAILVEAVKDIGNMLNM